MKIGQVLARLLLADEIGQPLGPQRGFQRVVFLAFGRDDAVALRSSRHALQRFTDQRAGFGVLAQIAATARATASAARASE